MRLVKILDNTDEQNIIKMNNFKLSEASVDVETLKKALDAKSDVVILDVRTHEEYGRGHIKDSINIPISDLVEKVENILTDKNKKIYVYCLSGARSERASEELVRLGFGNVYNVRSGLLGWRAHQYPLEI